MRKSWTEYFLDLADLVATRATCPRAHCGCVLVQDRSIISTGYNGSVDGEVHCEDEGCEIVNNHCVRTIHAEENAILQAAVNGVSTRGAWAYITADPCSRCFARLVRAGISRIIYRNLYKNGQTQPTRITVIMKLANAVWSVGYEGENQKVHVQTWGGAERITNGLSTTHTTDEAPESRRAESREESQSCL